MGDQSSPGPSTVYVAYDIKGIQQQIFAAPRLKYIVGASALVHELDVQRVPKLARESDAEHIFGGGGRGLFLVAPRGVDRLVARICAAVHELGLDVRIGVGESPSVAMLEADRFYGFVPESLDGPPCSASGRLPVAGPGGQGRRRSVHPVIWARLRAAESDSLGKSILDELSTTGLPPQLRDRKLAFLRNVSPEPIPDEDDEAASRSVEDGRAGQAALGNRNRWAVVCLDGNDIGSQHREAGRDRAGEEYLAWLRSMSAAMSTATRSAMIAATRTTLEAWASDPDAVAVATRRDETIVLPLRPLILGGDDATVLCHGQHAFDFAKTFCRAFAEQSTRLAQEHERRSGQPLWPATGNRLTMSAGILFVKTTYPLHGAVLIAENLLAMAKHRGRSCQSGGPAPAAIDWESVTESFVDHTAARRQRELRFDDGDIDREIRLTARPYLIDELDGDSDSPLQIARRALLDPPIPRTVGSRLFDALRRPYAERRVALAGLAKRYPKICDALAESAASARCGPGWHVEGQEVDRVVQTTAFLDALLMMEEEHRLDQETAS